MNIITLSYLMGHSTIITTQRYINIADRVSGKILAHSPTKDIRVPKHLTGYAEIVKALTQSKKKYGY